MKCQLRPVCVHMTRFNIHSGHFDQQSIPKLCPIEACHILCVLLAHLNRNSHTCKSCNLDFYCEYNSQRPVCEQKDHTLWVISSWRRAVTTQLKGVLSH